MVLTRERLNATWRGNGGLTPMSNYLISMDGGDFTETDSGTNHLFQEITDGPHTLVLIGYDRAGNFNSTKISFTVDPDISGIIITYPHDGDRINLTEFKASWVLNGLTHLLERVEYRMDGGSWTIALIHSADFMNLSEGDHTLDVRAFDIRGNTAVDISHFFVDVTKPSILTMSHDGTNAPAIGPIVIGFSEEIGSVNATLNGITPEKELVGATLTLETGALSPGNPYTLNITAMDLAGNVVEKTLTFKTGSKGTVSGRIVDKNGNPVSGARIVFDTGEEAEVNYDGTFSIEVKAGPRTAAIYDNDGNEIGTFDIDVIGGISNNMGDIVVESREEENGSSWWILIVIAVIVILILIAIIAFVLISKAKETEEEEFEEEDWEDEESYEYEWEDDEF
jgi:hypothetical protein